MTPTELLKVVNITTDSITVDFTGGEVSSYSVGEVLSTSPQNCDNISETSIYIPVTGNTMTFDFYAGSINKSFDFGDGFNTGVEIFGLAEQSDGKIIVGGYFTTYQGVSANNIIRLNTDGSRDTSFDIGTGFDNAAGLIKIQSDGKIIVQGYFTTYQGVSANNIIRLNTDGSKDTSFDIGTGFNGVIYSISIQSDGKIILGGDFTTYQGVLKPYLIRLNSNGSIDNTLNTGTEFNGVINTTSIQSDGKIIVGGEFTTYRGISANNIIRLNADGSRDNTFNLGTGFNGSVSKTSIQSDGKIILTGGFSTYQGVSAIKIIRLNADGTRDNTFNAGTSIGDTGDFYTISIQLDNKIILGGLFDNYQGVSANSIIRLNTDGSRDTSFDVGTGFNNFIYTSLILSNENILLGGAFTTYQGISAKGLITLNNDNNGSCYCITATDTLGAQYETGLICLLPEPTPTPTNTPTNTPTPTLTI